MVDQLIKRHGSHGHGSEHELNAPYGYAVFACGVVWLAFITLVNNTRYLRGKRKVRTAIVVSGLVWLASWVFLVFFKSTDTLNGFARRCGRCVYALLPLALALCLRPSILPNSPYLNLVSCHKWIGRLIALGGTIHGVSYFVYFCRTNKKAKMLKIQNILGGLTLLSLLILALTTIRPIRRRCYKLVMVIHYPLAVVTVVLGAIHGHAVLFFLLWCVAFLIIQKTRNLTSATTCEIDVRPVSRDLSLISLPRDVLPSEFQPGSHLRLSPYLPWYNILRWLAPTHPYTVASLSCDKEATLLVRRTRFHLTSGMTCMVEGPYSNNLCDLPFEMGVGKDIKVLLVVAGSGLSMAAPLKRYWDSLDIESRVVWSVSRRSDVPALSSLGLSSDFIVYVTGESSPTDHESVVNPAFKHEEEIELEELLHDDDDDNDNESKEYNPTDENNGTASSSDNIAQAPIVYGRPVFGRALDGFIDPLSHSSALVVACGPPGFVSDVESWANSERLPFASEVYSI